MTKSSFTWEFCREDKDTVVRVRGPLDESAPLADLAQLITHAVCIDVYEISAITSMGIRGWLSFVHAIAPKGQHRIRRCPPFFVTQMNMIPNFTGNFTIESIMLPYYCDPCGQERLVLYDVSALGDDAKVPKSGCPVCNQLMNFDDLESRYLAFLRDPDFKHAREPKPAGKSAAGAADKTEGDNKQAHPTQVAVLTDVIDILNRAREAETPVTISLSDIARVLTGRLDDVAEDHTTVALTSLAGLTSAEDIRLGQHCVVTFHHDGRPVFFLTTITDHIWTSRQSRRPLVELVTPNQVTAAEVRRALRIPIPEESGISVETFVDAAMRHQPRLKNLSVSGMLIEFDDAQDPKFEVYDRIEANISFESHSAVLRGMICRREDEAGQVKYGVHFPEISIQGELKPSPALQSIVTFFEERWLRKASGNEEP